MTQPQPQRHSVRMLIPDMLPLDHVSLNEKRIRFIKGQGVLLYDDIHVVEVYVPYSRTDDLEFFGVQRHFGKIERMRNYYQRLPILHVNDVRVTKAMKDTYDEAMFHYLPEERIAQLRRMPEIKREHSITREVHMQSSLSGAA